MKKEYLVGKFVGGLMECTKNEFVAPYTRILANSRREARKIYNKIHNCDFFYGAVMCEIVDGRPDNIDEDTTLSKVEDILEQIPEADTETNWGILCETREEQIWEAAEEYAIVPVKRATNGNKYCEAREGFRSNFMHGAEWADRTLTDRAVEWLINASNDGRIHLRNHEEFEREFRKAMRE